MVDRLTMAKPPLAALEPTEVLEPEVPVTMVGDGTSLDFLRAIYRDPSQPMHRRMRAAIAALPHEHPKLTAIAQVGGGKDFAAPLEAANARLLELRSSPAQLAPEVLEPSRR